MSGSSWRLLTDSPRCAAEIAISVLVLNMAEGLVGCGRASRGWDTPPVKLSEMAAAMAAAVRGVGGSSTLLSAITGDTAGRGGGLGCEAAIKSAHNTVHVKET